MKYSILLLVSIVFLNCSPKLAPDAGWGRGRWVVAEMKGVPVQQSGGRRDAHISFDVSQKQFSGNGGCNQINGTYTVGRNSIDFKDVTSTRMACQDLAFEKAFLEALASVNKYELKGEELVLKNKKKVVLVLKAR